MKCVITTPLGDMVCEERCGALVSLRLAGAGESRMLPPPSGELEKRTADWLHRYFAGEAPECGLPLEPSGSAFQRRVWQAARDVSYGQTISYGELARRIGCGSARAVGAALAKNPIWILIPCHRVLGADGSLTGYAGGLEKKAALLALEQN